MKNTLSQFLSMEEMDEKVVDLQEINNSLESYQKESDFITREIDSSMEAISSLETLITSLESLKENDYISKGSWELYKVYKRDVYRKNHLSMTNASLESFEEGSIHTLVQVALEEDNNNKRNIFQKIWDFLVKMFNNFIGFIKNIFIVQDAIKKEANELKRKVSGMADANFQGKVPENMGRSLASNIIINDSLNVAENFRKFPEILKKTHLNEISKLVLGVLNAFKNDVQNAVRGSDADTTSVEAKKLSDALMNLYPLDNNLIKSFQGTIHGVYEKVYASEKMPGNTQLVIGYKTAEEGSETQMPDIYVYNPHVFGSLKDDTVVKVDNKKDAMDILDNIIKTVDVWENISKDSEKVTKEAANIANQLKPITSKLGDVISDVNKIVKEYQDIIIKFIKINENINKVFVDANKAAIKLIKYAIAKPEQTQSA
nr:MAG TPA: internal head protein [Caudoviricetes sp.]